ncbi:oligosaccharide flippase family protein [Novosphingobium sp. G106]|uniref:lipopolysaccharide biosynthesis protein n=1 Tax=Novosphingobium sp. G106 TaxID=2849500 RepID=UPI001C2D9F5E|nr:oligosaccharide flippase family protein [Novosphingobium sp. G106]MBV1687040.1 oligosaccharide flippase family protein [Novosphingobium sp. G106]
MADGAPLGRTIKQGAVTTALGFAIRFGARILFLYIAARLFGVALFGAYSLAVAAIELAVCVGGLGAKRLLFKYLDAAGDRQPIHVVLDSVLTVFGACMALAAAIIAFVALLPESLLSANVATGLTILAPMIAGQALLDVTLAGTRWKHVMRYEVTARSIVEPYVGVAAAIAAYWLGWNETGLLVSYWAGTLVALGYAFWGLRRAYFGLQLSAYRIEPARLMALVRDSASATLNEGLQGLFGRVDMYLVGFFLGEVGAGIYGMARQIRTPVRQVRQSFDGLLNPIIARTIATRGPGHTGLATAAASRLILAVQLPVLVALVLIGEPLLASFGPGFVTGYWAMVLLTAAEMFQGAFSVSDLIILYNRPLAAVRITGANIGCNVVAGCLLMPQFGVTGAALSVMIGVFAGIVLRRLTLQRSFGVAVPFHHSAGPMSAALLAMAGAFAVRSLVSGPALWSNGAALATGLLGYAAALRIWMAAAREDWSLGEFEPEGA